MLGNEKKPLSQRTALAQEQRTSRNCSGSWRRAELPAAGGRCSRAGQGSVAAGPGPKVKVLKRSDCLVRQQLKRLSDTRNQIETSYCCNVKIPCMCEHLQEHGYGFIAVTQLVLLEMRLQSRLYGNVVGHLSPNTIMERSLLVLD